MAGEDDLVRKVKGSVVMIARKNDLQLLNTAKVDMFGDGTFKYSPRFFSQMYSFFVFNQGFYCVAHFLLTNKSQATYKTMIQMLIDECQVSGFNLKENLKGCTMMLDFEKAMINATKIHFQDCKVQGCSSPRPKLVEEDEEPRPCEKVQNGSQPRRAVAAGRVRAATTSWPHDQQSLQIVLPVSIGKVTCIEAVQGIHVCCIHWSICYISNHNVGRFGGLKNKQWSRKLPLSLW